MCGIIGFNWEDRDLLKKSCKLLVHRGPDQFGYYTGKEISLGHRRLSIIDLSDNGKQPMSNEDNSIWLVYNGEIYNFQELREELDNRGHIFKSNTDTEVIIHSYEEWGEDCVKRFNGMFAFAIWDDNKKKLFLARDRLGIKPLYYFLNDRKFFFASEIKAILSCEYAKKEIDLDSINHYVTLAYVPSPRTIFKNIFQLMPGHILICYNNIIKIERYWNLNFNHKNRTEREAIKQMEIILNDAVQKRMVSDVPLGIFLSGGLDSSLIAALMKNYSSSLKTFSIGFEEAEFNETNYAREMADYLKTDHKEFTVKPNAIKVLPKIIYSLDQPFADPSALPTYYLSKLTKKYVTVALSGDGADELFAGYRRYVGGYLDKKISLIPSPIRNLITFVPATRKRYDPNKYLGKLIRGLDLEKEDKHAFYMQHFEEDLKDELYDGVLKNRNPSITVFKDHLNYLNSRDQLDIAQYLDIKTYLADDILVKVDRMSMAHSLEVRSPFLDYRMFELMTSFPTKLRLNRLNGKYILKKFARGYIPKKIVYRKKEGFSVPLNRWFDNELKDIIINVLTDDKTIKRGYFNKNVVNKIIRDHLQRKKEYSTQLWILLNLELWHRMFIDRDKPETNINKLI